MRMIDLLDRRTRHAARSTPIMLCSVCGDLRISEIVDMPNWVVSFYFPRIVLRVTEADTSASAGAQRRAASVSMRVRRRRCKPVLDDISFELASRRDALHRRRKRVRQVGDLALDHGAAAEGLAAASPPAISSLGDTRTLQRFPTAQMRHVRGGEIAMIFQEPMTSLNPVMSDRRAADRGDPRAPGSGNAEADRAADARGRAHRRAGAAPDSSIRTNSPAACASA